MSKALLRRLGAAGIRTVADLRQRPREDLARRFGASAGEMLYRQARGIASAAIFRSRRSDPDLREPP